MLSDELRQLLELSGGKIVVSQGDVNDSYVVIKLGQYLNEFNAGSGKRMLEKRDAVLTDEAGNDEKLQNYEENRELTDVELLDKINSDIEQLRQRKMEREVENLLEEDPDEYDYDYL